MQGAPVYGGGVSNPQAGPSVRAASGSPEPREARHDDEHWQRLAEDRAAEVEALRAQIDVLRADLDALRTRSGERAGTEGAAAPSESKPLVLASDADGDAPEAPTRPAKAGDMAGRITVWLVTVTAMLVLGRVLDYDQDPAAALWFITVAIVVTVAMVTLARKR